MDPANWQEFQPEATPLIVSQKGGSGKKNPWESHLLGGGHAAGSPFPPPRLGLAGFFFPLL